jgi:hypothetical protein
MISPVSGFARRSTDERQGGERAGVGIVAASQTNVRCAGAATALAASVARAAPTTGTRGRARCNVLGLLEDVVTDGGRRGAWRLRRLHEGYSNRSRRRQCRLTRMPV